QQADSELVPVATVTTPGRHTSPAVTVPGGAAVETVMVAVNQILCPLKHAGLTKAVLFHSFGVDSPGKVPTLLLEVLERGMGLFRHLCTRLAEEGKPAMHPDQWVAQEVQTLASDTEERQRWDAEESVALDAELVEEVEA